jgi:hypothetical protein
MFDNPEPRPMRACASSLPATGAEPRPALANVGRVRLHPPCQKGRRPGSRPGAPDQRRRKPSPPTMAAPRYVHRVRVRGSGSGETRVQYDTIPQGNSPRASSAGMFGRT